MKLHQQISLLHAMPKFKRVLASQQTPKLFSFDFRVIYFKLKNYQLKINENKIKA